MTAIQTMVHTVYPRVICEAMYNARHDFDVLIAWKKLTPMYSAVPNL